LALEIARTRVITPSNCLSSIGETDSLIVAFVIPITGTTESLMARKSRPASRPAKKKTKKSSKAKKPAKKAKAARPAKARRAAKAKTKKAPPQGFFSSLFS
jgi:hypothetical protein